MIIMSGDAKSGLTRSSRGVMKRKSMDDCVRRALKDGPFAMRQLAAECGLSYDVLRSWRTGRRRPNRESIRKLAAGLTHRADRLKGLAAELRKMV
jgi:transcriptional regulator with XRE-family HTH domain